MWDTDQRIMDRTDRISLVSNLFFEVIADDDNVKVLKGEYRKFRLYMKIMDLEMDIDMDKPAAAENESLEGIMQRLFSKIKGRAFTLKVDEKGNVIAVSGFDEIITGIIDSAGLNEEMALQMRASLIDQFSEQELKNQLAHVFVIFPDNVINRGDSWQRNYGIAGKIPADFSTTYTVAKIEGDQVTLDARSIIGPAGQGMEIKGKQEGTLLVNIKTGLVMKAEFQQEMQTNVNDLLLTIKGTGKVNGNEAD